MGDYSMADVAVAIEEQSEAMKKFRENIYSRLEKLEAKPQGREVPFEAGKAPAIFSRGMSKDSDPLNIGGFFRGMLSGNWAGVDREHELYKATMTTGSEGAGLIPERVAQEIWFAILTRNALLAAGAPMIQLAQAGVKVPTESVSPSAAWVAEGATISDSGGEFSAQSLTAHKIAFLREISNEMLQDSPAAADVYLRQILLNALSRGLDTGFLNGTGADNQPTGLLTGSPDYAVDKSSTDLTADMLMEAYWALVGKGAVPGQIRSIMAPEGATFLDQQKASTAGSYLEAPIDIERVVSSQVAVASGTPDTSKVLIGDFSQAVRVYSFGGMRLDVDASAAFASDSITFRLVQRVDIQVAQSDLLQRLDGVQVSS
ncbi:MAG: phage major capsid protein [Spirochaetaceae bacterium]|nr:phage major capsid protein [Spirochaetaceae bacterium]MCF7948539.1 phage major capsid protein [Spirochaetia bacterium]MCF7951017.1 phage major capsid protein [Spirochaetaceae bacterium]